MKLPEVLSASKKPRMTKSEKYGIMKDVRAQQEERSFSMEKKRNFRFGKNAQRILRFGMPVMVFLAFALTVYTGLPESAAPLRERETVLLLLETLSRIFVCLALGVVLADYAEKKKV